MRGKQFDLQLVQTGAVVFSTIQAYRSLAWFQRATKTSKILGRPLDFFALGRFSLLAVLSGFFMVLHEI